MKRNRLHQQDTPLFPYSARTRLSTIALTGMLAEIDAKLPECSPLRESLQKAGLAIAFAFMDGRREEIELVYGNLDAELSDKQKDYFRSIGIDPDADPTD